MILPVIGLHQEYSAVEDERENWRLWERLLRDLGVDIDESTSTIAKFCLHSSKQGEAQREGTEA
jgi:hypothetical protein